MSDFLEPQPTTPDDSEHLSNLQALVQQVMADGKISREEAGQLREALFADGQLTPDELDIVRMAMREHLGDGHLEFDWD